MAIGITTTKTTGRLVFDLVRDGETTTRTIDIPYPKDDATVVQSAVDSINAGFTDSSNAMNTCVQPANWRDTNDTELQWTTTGVRYEIVVTSITPVEPEEIAKRVESVEEQATVAEEHGEV